MISSIFEPEDEKGWHMLVRPVYGDKQAGPDAPNVDTRDLTAEGKLAKGVDLGLSVKWATYNLGAKSETEPGSYFSWATTAAGSDFSLSQYNGTTPQPETSTSQAPTFPTPTTTRP